HAPKVMGRWLGAAPLALARELGAPQHIDDAIQSLVLLGEPLNLGSQHRLLVRQPVSICGEPGVLLCSSDDQSLEALYVVREFVERQCHGGTVADLLAWRPHCNRS